MCRKIPSTGVVQVLIGQPGQREGVGRVVDPRIAHNDPSMATSAVWLHFEAESGLLTTQYSPLAPKTTGSPWRILMTRSAPPLRSASNEPSLKIGRRFRPGQHRDAGAAARSTSVSPAV